MINLNKVEMILFDFDDTLCIREDYRNNHDPEYPKNIILGNPCWERCNSNKFLKEFMKLCAEKDIRLGLISATFSFKHMERKQEWVKNNYGFELENFCVGSPDSKVQMLQNISKAYNLKPGNILIVDDFYYTLREAANAGFQAAMPMEVVNYMLSV